MSRPAPPPELDAEREVDLARAAGAVATRWWLPLLGLVAGLVIGWAAALGGTDVYRATALVYTGFPLAVGGGALPTVASTPAMVRQIVASEDAVQQAARASGMRPGQVRAGTSVTTPTTGARGVQAQLVNVSVRGGSRRRVRVAANTLARLAVTRLGRFVDAKIENYDRQLEAYDRALAALTRSIDETTRALRGRALSTTDRLVLASTLATSEGRRASFESERFSAQQLATQARDFERPQILARAAPQEVTARSKRSSLVVAGALGLLLGLVAALVWDPLASRLRG